MTEVYCEHCEKKIDIDCNTKHFNEEGYCTVEVEDTCTSCGKVDCTCDEETMQSMDEESRLLEEIENQNTY